MLDTPELPLPAPAALRSTAPRERAPAAVQVTWEDFSWLRLHREQLEALHRAQARPSPFQSFEWLEAWWTAYGAGYRPVVVVLSRGDTLLGVLPLMQRRRGPWRVLEWMGTGRSDRSPLLLRPGEEQVALRALVEHLGRSRRAFDLLSLRTVEEEALSAWKAVAPARFYRDAEDVSPTLELRGSWEDYLSKTLGKSHRQKVRRLFNEQQRLAQLRVDCHREVDSALLAEMTAVEADSWKARHGNVKMQGQGAVFYRRFLTALASRGWLELWTCRAQGTLHAFLITFVVGGRVYSYNNAYREDYPDAAGASPGTLLFAWAVRSAHQRGLRSYDFLRGAEEYKYRWGARDVVLYHLLLRAPGWRGLLASALHVRLRWRARRSPLLRRLHDWWMS